MILNLHAHPQTNLTKEFITKEYNEQLVMSDMRGGQERNRIWVASSFPSSAMEHTDGVVVFFFFHTLRLLC